MAAERPDPLRERVVLMAETGPNRYFKLIISGPWDTKTCDHVIQFLGLMLKFWKEDMPDSAIINED